MNERKTLVLLCASLLMTSLTAYASERSRSRMSFENLDANGDSTIALEEFVANAPAGRRSPEEVFRTLDTNKDGAISQDEFDARRTGRGRRR